MGDFVLSGAADALAPIAEKLGLTEVASVPSFAQDARGPSHWRRIFPRSKRKPRVASVTAQPSRPCAQGRDAMVKAVEYALWLAKRDGAPIAHKDWRVYDAAKWDAVKWDFSAPGAALVKFRRVNRADGSHVNQAESVFFGGIDRKIAIPHCGYDATKPAREETDESAPLSG